MRKPIDFIPGVTKLEVGQTYNPPKSRIVRDGNTVRGAGWTAQQTVDGFIVEYLKAAQGGGKEYMNLDRREFEALAAGEVDIDELFVHHARYRYPWPDTSL